ncbi:hypothetical protein UVI_02029530 [Ustilaginoidea virens]|uniref:Fe2OG dioxygenase domain-containing protein n=1 Tax=Ustilaginoidea virens TaxID=1159556 RepID=A0A1B5KVW7_USTVR|nr:hypothetical protein UVI_02029530 [Ustilaginoidea virens]
MFDFDKASLPHIVTRKALILVDFQNDFLEDNGALPSIDSEGLVDRTVQLVNGFRGYGDVVWVQSQFKEPVLDTESIVISDTPRPSRHRKGSGWTPDSLRPADPDEPPDPEAFLSQAEATCVKKDSWGAKPAPAVEAVMKKGDAVITKTQYSGFNGTHLLRSLRAKMVMDVFICGSMANVGVYATAIDAAGHGLAITVVEDCCGHRSEQRQLSAVRNLIEFVGCEIASADEVIESLQPSPIATPRTPIGEVQLNVVTSPSRASADQRQALEIPADVVRNALPERLAKQAFDKLRNEVRWQRMLHQGGEVPRLVAVQGHVAEDGSMPVYRHPSDESPPLLPFSPTILAIKAETEKHLGHPLNHVLIQFYRDGSDYISEHSDKTMDVVKGSFIANVSLGAERTMVFRTKRLAKDPSRAESSSPLDDAKRQIHRAQLPHNSLCRMGLRTNMKWLHSIRQDKRAEREKSPAELAFGGGRISLTFRRIGTFLDRDEAAIWGQGAVGKTRDAARPVVNGLSSEAVEMVKAFGAENNSSDFDWDTHYGRGFDVLHFSNTPRLLSSADPVTNMRLGLMLAEHGVSYAKGSLAPSPPDANNGHGSSPSTDAPAVRFVDNDEDKSAVDGDVAITLYLDAVHDRAEASPADLAVRFSRFQQALKLADLWRQQDPAAKLGQALLRELALWDLYAAQAGEATPFLGKSGSPSMVDFTVWPVLHALAKREMKTLARHGSLRKYYESFATRESVRKVLGKNGTGSA